MIVTKGRMLVVTGSADGVVRLYLVPFGGGGGGDGDDDVQLLGSEQVGSSGGEGGDVVLPVTAIVHPSSNLEDGATIIVGGSDGSVNVFKSVPSGLKKITHLKSSEDGSVAFSSGCLHPDGLIYAAGTTDGKLLIYDLKTQAVAGTLQGHDGNPINYITISENGYHVATSSSSSSAESPIHIWDLRKLKLSATITPPEGVGTITSLAFDPMGLYLAYSGAEATKICVVKDWDRVVGTLSKTKTGGKKNATPPSCGGVVWGGKGLDDDGGSVWVAAGCDGEKPIRFWGVE
jgi:pre-mRNA-processing factor 19